MREPIYHPKKKQANEFHFSNLFYDVVIKIFQELSIIELSRVSKTCRRFRSLAFDDNVWLFKCYRLGFADIHKLQHKSVFDQLKGRIQTFSVIANPSLSVTQAHVCPSEKNLLEIVKYIQARDIQRIWQKLQFGRYCFIEKNWPREKLIDESSKFEIWQQGHSSLQLQVITLNGLNLVTLPPTLSIYTNLTRIELSYNFLFSIRELCSLTFLKAIDASHNRLTNLSQDMSTLKALEELKICSNVELKLPAIIYNFTSLISLNLRDCNVNVVSNAISNLVNLVFLYLGKNSIQELPEEIGELKQLRVLELPRNQLQNLPNRLWELTHLEALNLDFNLLTSLSSQISCLIKLSILCLFENEVVLDADLFNRLPSLKWLYIDPQQNEAFSSKIAFLTNTYVEIKPGGEYNF